MYRQVGKGVYKYFPGHGTFSGKVTYYAPKSDTFRVVYDDGDDEVLTYKDMRDLVTHTAFTNSDTNFAHSAQGSLR